ncbi:heme biosynthesis protein HemY [Rhodoferax koreense]|uniref:Heme biosynthesis protein HemY n=1 Tax=Rhodoferax koreensis TaxID=1842727 RepID=A0A1P8JT58_9BURK|nr:heme biosynthesis HemY N-terminal domain-containing protein [Rhodoferax koreense]APW36952.1 heme biosynthesis protein HemY [Rhodoferax koreense]
MRAIAWLLALFAAAVAVALFAGDNQGTVTLFWPPYRVDLSLNLVLLLLVGSFVVLHLALRALAALFSMPQQARRWRVQQRERAMHASLLDALSHLLAGRFLRARKAAEAALGQEQALTASGHHLAHADKLRAMSHLVTAESAQALQDRATRDEHLLLAIDNTAQRDAQETREGVQLRAARWALSDRDAHAALQWLDALPQGAARRTLALRARLKAARLARQTMNALETARLLAKHRAFSQDGAQSLLRNLAMELINDAHDPAQLQRAWGQLDSAERQMPEVAIHAAQRLAALQGDVAQARQWLLPIWERRMAQPEAWSESQSIKLIRALEAGFAASEDPIDLPWLHRIEAAQQRHGRDANLQYLAGMACLRHQLWGKAQQLLTQSVQNLQDTGLQRSAWRALATLAEQREDEAAAREAYKRAATV